jgi:hypothetical protein
MRLCDYAKLVNSQSASREGAFKTAMRLRILSVELIFFTSKFPVLWSLVQIYFRSDLVWKASQAGALSPFYLYTGTTLAVPAAILS